jgi:signal transduction histidine kinase
VGADDNAVLRRLLDVALAAAGEPRSDRVLRLVVDAARDLVGAHYAAIGVPDGAGGFATFLTAGIDGATWKAIGALPRQHGLLGVLLREPATVVIEDIRTDPRFAGWPSAHPDMAAFLGVPIAAGGEILAELYLTDRADGSTFTVEDRRLVETLAAHAALALANAQRVERSRELAVAQERTRLARDLHDSVTQTLFGLTLAAESATHLAEGVDPRLATQIGRLRTLAAAARDDMRILIETLRPVDVDHEGLGEALRKRVDLVGRVHDVAVTVEISGDPQLPPAVARELFYVANEALTNALQHAQAGRIEITLSEQNGRIALCVADDGRGFDLGATEQSSRRLGLASMRERAEAVDGALAIRTAPGAGTRVCAEVTRG